MYYCSLQIKNGIQNKSSGFVNYGRSWVMKQQQGNDVLCAAIGAIGT
jgi:hypothetical protein